MLRDALRRAVESQLANVKKPTVAGRAEAAKAHRWLWVLPTLLLRVPPSDEQTDETTKAASARRRETIVTDRVKLMETDHAVDLLETYVLSLKTIRAARIRTRYQPGPKPSRNTTGEPYEKLWTVASNRPKLPLSQDLQVPRDELTMLELCRLVAVDVDDEERRAQTNAATRACALHAACPPLRMKHLRSRVWRLKPVASPGPSGWRNTHIQAVARARGGMQLLMQWVALYGHRPGPRRTLQRRGPQLSCIRSIAGTRERRQASRPDASFDQSLARRRS